uniref:Conotoxin n=2 Tax=Conus episcopatus TaxID=88764 RepID=A0A0K2SET0_CONEP|nr:Conotoxin Superfamily T [Conus episcopatus]
MRCLPVLIILLLLTASGPSIETRPKTEDGVLLSSFRDNAERTLQKLWNYARDWCDPCPWGSRKMSLDESPANCPWI